jgi:predicted RNase H-like HicB family nuclease
MRQTYQAIAARDGRWWFVHVPGEQGLVTQVHRLDQAEPMLREVIGLMRKVPEDSFDVVIEPDLSSIGELRAVIERAVQERERAAAAQDSASAAIRDAVAQIRASGFTTRDAGALVGVSPQRISQLATTGQAGRAPRRAAELRAPYDVSR